MKIKLFGFAVIIEKKFGVVWHQSKSNIFNNLRKLWSRYICRFGHGTNITPSYVHTNRYILLIKVEVVLF